MGHLLTHNSGSSCTICRARSKMKMQRPLFKTHQAFQDGDRRALTHHPHYGAELNSAQPAQLNAAALLPIYICCPQFLLSQFSMGRPK